MLERYTNAELFLELARRGTISRCIQSDYEGLLKIDLDDKNAIAINVDIRNLHHLNEKFIHSPMTSDQHLMIIFDAIAKEVEYAKQKWEDHPGRDLRDVDKPIEFWIAHMENYLTSARQKCYGVDKTDALRELRKLAGLAVRCFMGLGIPKRS